MNRTYHKRGELVEGFAVAEHPLYSVWADMHGRCANPNSSSYKNYGARGISVCARWNHFKNFVADMGKRPIGLTLERKNNNKGYSKSNCTWASRSAQCVNRRKLKNNSTGETGIVAVGSRFDVRFDYEGERYKIGRVDTVEQGLRLRKRFVKQFFKNKAAAIASISGETLWCTSSTKERGITVHSDGGYLVRCTVAGVRHYVGYYTKLKLAIKARDEFVASKNS